MIPRLTPVHAGSFEHLRGMAEFLGGFACTLAPSPFTDITILGVGRVELDEHGTTSDDRAEAQEAFVGLLFQRGKHDGLEGRSGSVEFGEWAGRLQLGHEGLRLMRLVGLLAPSKHQDKASLLNVHGCVNRSISGSLCAFR